MTLYNYVNEKRSMALTLAAENSQEAEQMFQGLVAPNFWRSFKRQSFDELPDNSIKLLKWWSELEFDLYDTNDTVCITANDAINGDEVIVCTVNAENLWQGSLSYKKAFKFPVVVIDNRDYKEGIYDDLVGQGVIEPGAYIAGTNGRVHVCKLTEKWQKIANEQLSLKYKGSPQ